jgi:beta-galactosidase
MDMIRSASKGKPFWCAEMASGASWRARSGWEIDKGRVANASDIKLYSLMNFAGGARGIFSPRWRPLQDGRFAGSFAFYDMDGSPTARSEAASFMAKWANAPAQHTLMQAKPVKSDIGILVVPESQIHCYVSEDDTKFYYRSISGAYQAFLFNNIQPDFIQINDLNSEQEILYLPYPVMLTRKTVEKIKNWVNSGGRLISEGCPAYFGNQGRAGIRQPHYGMDELFGVEQEYVQFTPDLLDDLVIQMNNGIQFRGGIYLQSYSTTGGEAVGFFDNKRVAVVDNHFGSGKTRLVGSFPGYAYSMDPDSGTRSFFRELLCWAGKKQHISSTDERLVARLQSDHENIFLWISNVARERVDAELVISTAWGHMKDCEPIWGDRIQIFEGNRMKISIPAREMLIMKLI